jgi:hypothetical protein
VPQLRALSEGTPRCNCHLYDFYPGFPPARE